MAKISWSGQSCFQISVSNSRDHEANIVIDPFDDDTGLRVPNLSGDILLVTHDHHDHNNIKAVKGDPFLINGPGEYEVKGVFVQGINSTHGENPPAGGGKNLGQNTIYTIEAEDMRFCHLGDLGQKELTDEQLEKIGTIDVLMIPVGGEYTISSVEAMKIVSQIEPKIVIPMHYEIPKLKMKLDPVEKFLKAMGKNAGAIVPQEKFLAKESTLPKEGTEVVVLLP
jgi:L-ascorbate metabolism protein UlaG (beta-lactamase superfamily)